MRAMLTDAAVVVSGSFAASLLVKATLTVSIALVAHWLSRRNRAAMRHVLLSAAFVVLLALPAAMVLFPLRAVSFKAVEPAQPEPAVLFVSGPTPLPPGPPRHVAPQPYTSSGIPLSLTTVWVSGTLMCLLPMLAGMWQTRTLRRSARPSPRGRTLARDLWSPEGVSRPLAVLQHHSVSGPMTWGIVRPTILLPQDAETWSDDELRRALIHELEHVRRMDWASLLLARTVCAVYWFHPLVWMAWRRLRLDAERACDDAVLQRAEPTAYANQLVVLAERLATADVRPLLAMASCRDLTTRVRAVLDGAQTRGRAGALCVGSVIAATIVLVMALAPLRAVSQAQVPDAAAQGPALAFETASVKPNNSGDDEQYLQMLPGGDFRAVNFPLRQLIVFAYQIQPFQLSGGPDWIANERFDILAKPGRDSGPVMLPSETPGNPGTMRLMLRTLLAERFKLAVRKETREADVFEMILARQDGKPGPQLRPAAINCAAQMAAARAGAPPPATLGPPGPGSCGLTINPARIRGGGVPLTALANLLSQPTQRVVVDRTGLTGEWDLEVTYMPDPSQFPRLPPEALQHPSVDANAPSLFTALEEQLGLRLRPARGPVEMLVIDGVGRPTAN